MFSYAGKVTTVLFAISSLVKEQKKTDRNLHSFDKNTAKLPQQCPNNYPVFLFKIAQFSVGQEELKKICEIGLMLFIILGRWMLPRGSVTRDQLSVLLLEYVAIAADILELFEAFDDEQVFTHKKLPLLAAVYKLNLRCAGSFNV